MKNNLYKEINFSKNKYIFYKSKRYEIQSIKNFYDKTPISLYFNAIKLEYTPVFKYLSFYQVLEYYFPKYSRKDTINNVKQILRDPTFSSHSDDNIIELINKINNKKEDEYKESLQIRTVLKSIINEEDLLAFFENRDRRKNYFTDKKLFEKMSVKKN